MKLEIPAFKPMLKANEHLAHGAISIDLGADVVMVVRCKDCKHKCVDDMGGFFRCRKTDAYMNDYDFCSYGERPNG